MMAHQSLSWLMATFALGNWADMNMENASGITTFTHLAQKHFIDERCRMHLQCLIWGRK